MVMKIIKHFLIRLLITAVPLLGLYFYAEMAFEANRMKEHPTDVGLGIAFLLIFILFVLCIGFGIDFIRRLRKKDYKIAMIDIPFLLPFIFIVLYFSCLMTSGGCFCDFIINLGKGYLPH
jgi:Ca2+/Na+ antiporter